MFNFTDWIISGALLSSPFALSTAVQTEPATVPAVTQTTEPAFNETAALANANAALNRLDTAKGKFTQVDFHGNFSTGAFYLNRPGRLRFEYDAPVPLLIVSDGTMLAIEDRDLETVDSVPLASTPLNLLLRNDTDLAAHANILSIAKKSGLVAIRVSDKSEEAEGQLELFFDPESYELKQWESIDANGAVTTVQLIETQIGASVSPALFRIEDPEDDDRRR